MILPSHDRYNYRINQLLDYNTTHGTLDIPYNYKKDVQLAKWVQSQRYEYRLLKTKKSGIKSYLTPERVELLDAIGFPWNNVKGTKEEGLTKRWMDKWSCLADFKEEHGHVRVAESLVYKGVKLGVWVKNQRRNARTKQGDDIMNHRVEKLNELGFIWDTRENGDTVYDVTWMKRYEDLKVFHERNLHFQLPKNSELAVWVKSQRVLYRQYQSNGNVSYSGFNMERIKLMDDIGFDWDGKKSLELRRNETWWKILEELRLFQEAFGHLDVGSIMRKVASDSDDLECSAKNEDFNVTKLHHWVNVQRVQYKRYSDGGKICLTRERIKALSSLGFVWNQHDEQWQRKFEQLKAFGDTYGHFDVPTAMPCAEVASTYEQSSDEFWNDITEVGRWARGQRASYRKYKRDEDLQPSLKDRMMQLENIGFLDYSDLAGDSPEEKMIIWDLQFAALEQFQAEHGHCMVTPGDDSNRLHAWTILQRRRFRVVNKNAEQNNFVSEIDLERLEKFKELGFVFNVHEYKFQSSLNRLKEYQSTFGHARVKPSYRKDPHLYPFVRRQRELYRARKLKHAQNSLSEERIEKLNAVGFVWCPRGFSVE